MATTAPLPAYQDPVADGTPQHHSGSIGPFFAVMSVIIVLTALSCIMGRVCAARVEGPDGWYDCVGWARKRCRRSGLGRDVVREAKAAVTAEQEPKMEERKQQPSLPMLEP